MFLLRQTFIPQSGTQKAKGWGTKPEYPEGKNQPLNKRFGTIFGGGEGKLGARPLEAAQSHGVPLGGETQCSVARSHPFYMVQNPTLEIDGGRGGGGYPGCALGDPAGEYPQGIPRGIPWSIPCLE